MATNKPTLHLAPPGMPTLDALIAMSRALTGRDPTPEELADRESRDRGLRARYLSTAKGSRPLPPSHFARLNQLFSSALGIS